MNLRLPAEKANRPLLDEHRGVTLATFRVGCQGAQLVLWNLGRLGPLMLEYDDGRGRSAMSDHPADLALGSLRAVAAFVVPERNGDSLTAVGHDRCGALPTSSSTRDRSGRIWRALATMSRRWQ